MIADTAITGLGAVTTEAMPNAKLRPHGGAAGVVLIDRPAEKGRSMDCDLFGDKHIDALVELGVIRSYPKNRVIVSEGDTSDQFYVLISGKLKVFLADDEGKEIIIDVLSSRQCFGEMALDREARSASVMTVEPSRLAVIQQDDFKRFLAHNPEAAFSLMVTLIRRARNLTRTIGNLALLDVYGRVARLLVDNAHDESGQLMVTARMTQQEIAQRIGSSREMVSRILTDLKTGGYITIENGRIAIKQNLPKRW